MGDRIPNAILEARQGGAPNKDAIARELFEQQEAIQNFHHKSPDERWLMSLDDTASEEPPTVDACLADELKWKGAEPEDELAIRNSEEWKLLHKIMREAKTPGQDSLLVRAHMRKIRNAQRERVGAQWVDDETLVSAGMYWRAVSRSVKRTVLRVSTAAGRHITVDMRCPNNPAVPSQGNHVEVRCDMGGIPQAPGWVGFILHGPVFEGDLRAKDWEWVPIPDRDAQNKAFTSGDKLPERKAALARMTKPEMYRADKDD